MLNNFFKWFFTPNREPVSILDIILWWEKRRVPFNLIIGFYGIFSLMIFFWSITTSGHLNPGDDAVEPLAFVVTPILLNICYTAGWFIEVLVKIINRSARPLVGVVLLKLGLGFSLFVISIPSGIWFTIRVIQLFKL